MAKTKYLDMAGLQVYDGLIKGVISEGDAKSLKSFQYDTATRTLKFFKSETPGETPDFSMVLPEQDLSGFLEKIDGGVKDNIVIIGEGGIVVDSGVKISDIATKAEVQANTSAIAVLNGTGEGSVNKKVADAVAAIVAEAPEAYDTLKEISDWISSHASDASAMNSQINTNKTDIASLKALIGELPEGAASETVVAYIAEVVGSSTSDLTTAIATAKSEAISTAATDATTKANGALNDAKDYTDGLNTAMDTRVGALESKVGDGYEAITEAEINALFAAE